jgi:hypothetical protein
LKQASRRGCGSIVEEEPTLWEKCLEDSTEIVTKKTLEAKQHSSAPKELKWKIEKHPDSIERSVV